MKSRSVQADTAGAEHPLADQSYTALGCDKVRCATETVSADLKGDADGFVTHYPTLTRRG